jgi:site-specific DNA-methyltransferase (adenine-specific)
MVTQTHEMILIFRKWVSEDYHEQRTLPDPESERKQQSALTKERWREITQSLWEVSPVRQSSLESDHDAVYPEELPKRAIQMYSFAEDRVLDPFGGIGTTGVAAKKAGRKYVGIEQSEEFASEARERIAQAEWDKPGYITPRNSTDTDSSSDDSASSQRSLDTF